MITEVRLEDATTLHVEVVGTGPPVVVCGGGPSASCDYLVADLAPLGRDASLIFHDYRGSGRSSASDPTTYTFEQLADDVIALASRLGHDSFDLLAHSMGGTVALCCALRHPAAVRRLVLIDTSPSGTLSRMALPTVRALGPLRTAKVLARAVVYALWWSWRSESRERTLARFAIMGTMQEGARRFRSEVRRREVLLDNDNAPELERRATTFDVVQRLDEIEQPTLVVYGSRDAPFVAGGRLLLAGLPNATELRLPGCGHHPLVEANAEVIAAARDFLTRPAAADGAGSPVS